MDDFEQGTMWWKCPARVQYQNEDERPEEVNHREELSTTGWRGWDERRCLRRTSRRDSYSTARCTRSGISTSRRVNGVVSTVHIHDVSTWYGHYLLGQLRRFRSTHSLHGSRCAFSAITKLHIISFIPLSFLTYDYRSYFTARENQVASGTEKKG